MAKTDQINTLCAPVVEGLGFEFWGIEYIAQGKHSVLRVFIEHENGISVDHCAEVSHQLAAVFDVEDPISDAYTLEVSSPGMDRPLFTLDHYARFVGEWVQMRLKFPYEGKRKIKGVIQGVEDDSVVVQVEEYEYLLPFEQIDKANILPVFDD
ncbi:MAG: ribosome maturation factor RimP [Natronospirillum sp.]